tara:strand:- start:400 stop:1236 length:837 start_codon:yes stop_codon:yes gene_type:complete
VHDYEHILYEIDGPVATITMNRPDTLNALTSLMQAEIRHALDTSERNEEVIGTVLTGAGRGFCSGVDMTELGELSKAGKRTGSSFDHLKADPGNPDNDPNYKSSPGYFLGLRKPLVAAINGACAGLGFSYATFCDMRFMDRKAKIVSSFSPRGLIAEHGTCWMLPRLVGPSHALDIFWSSRRVLAEEAYHMGWANQVSEEGEVVADAQNYLKEIAGTSAPISIMMMKKQVYKHMMSDFGDAMDETNRWMDESIADDDFKEGVASFVEKRPPNFARVKV